MRAGQHSDCGVSTSSDSTGVLEVGWGDEKWSKSDVECGEKVVVCFSLAWPPSLPFFPFSYCVLCFHFASLLELCGKKYYIPMPVFHSLNSRPTFIQHAVPTPAKPCKAQILSLSYGCHLMKTSINIRPHHLAVPLGWLQSPQISGHGERWGQPIIPSPPPLALMAMNTLSNAAGCRDQGLSSVPFKAKQSAKAASCSPSTRCSQSWL